MKDKKVIILTVITLFLISLLGIGIILAIQQVVREEGSKGIKTYGECVAAGYPVFEIYPEQCKTPDGRTFTNRATAIQEEEASTDTSNPPQCEQLSECINEFGFRMLSQLDSSTESILISPASIEMALLMTYNGANSTTAQEMATALSVEGISLDKINNNAAQLAETLNKQTDYVEMSLANSLWAQKDFNFLPTFINTTQKYFHAKVNNTDFQNNPTVAEKEINDWVSTNTNQKITNIVSNLPQNTRLILVNTVYFNGQWEVIFDEKLTEKADFTNAMGKISVDMMKQRKEKYLYYENDKQQLLELPYGMLPIDLL